LNIHCLKDEWREIEISGVQLFGEKPCGRCSFPNVNPQTGERNPKAEPYNTLYKLVVVFFQYYSSLIYQFN